MAGDSCMGASLLNLLLDFWKMARTFEIGANFSDKIRLARKQCDTKSTDNTI
jgi:hypothetical protein